MKSKRTRGKRGGAASAVRARERLGSPSVAARREAVPREGAAGEVVRGESAKVERASGRRVSAWVYVLVGVLVVAGAAVRLADAGRKFVWYDESVTLSLVSGYKGEDVWRRINAGEVGAEELRQFHRLKPGSGLGDVVAEVGRADPQLPPLYFVLARLWAQVFGGGAAGVRVLTAVLGLLALPAIFWLGRELFAAELTAWVALGLLAVSPFFIVYAQEARPYSLWATLTAAASAALLYALRSPSPLKAWALYAATLALGLYTHGLFLAVLAAHAVYVAACELRWREVRKFRLPRTARGFLLAASAALVAFAPWGWKIVEGQRTVQAKTEWLEEDLGWGESFERWVSGLGRVFLDFGGGSGETAYGINNWAARLAVWLAAALVVYSIYFLCRRAPRRTWLMVVLLGGCVFVPLALADLGWGGKRSTVGRYLFPTYLGAVLSVAHLFAAGVASADARRRRLWRAGLAVLLVGGVASCALYARAETWRNKGGVHLGRVAEEINRAERPLIVSDFRGMNVGNVLALSHRLDARVRVRVARRAYTVPVPAPPADVFYFGVPDFELRNVEAVTGRKLEPVRPPSLWRAVR